MNGKNVPSYSVEHPNHKGCMAVARYGDEGKGRRPDGEEFTAYVLSSIEFRMGCGSQFVKATKSRLPEYVELRGGRLPAEFDRMIEVGCAVKDVTETDLSFEHFWEAYGYKVGNKGRARKLWTALNDEERLLALRGAVHQRRHSESHKTDMPYAETYLSQRRWEGFN